MAETERTGESFLHAELEAIKREVIQGKHVKDVSVDVQTAEIHLLTLEDLDLLLKVSERGYEIIRPEGLATSKSVFPTMQSLLSEMSAGYNAAFADALTQALLARLSQEASDDEEGET